MPRRGFTPIELLLTMVVITFLAAISLPVFTLAREGVRPAALPEALSIASIDPPSAHTGPFDLEISGTGFDDTMKFALCTGGGTTLVEATDLVVVSATLLKCRMDLTGMPVGSWSVYLQRGDGASVFNCATSAGAYSVTNAEPVVESISPASAPNWGPVDVEITGTGFLQGAAVVLSGCNEFGTQYGAVPATNVTVESDKLIRCRLDLGSQRPGKRCVKITNVDGQWDGLREGFEITQAAPVGITSFTPSWAPNTGQVDLTVSGFGFHEDMEVTMCCPDGPAITATNVVLVSPTVLTCTMDLAGQPQGRQTTCVTRLGDGWPARVCRTSAVAFNVGAAPGSGPVITSIIPKRVLNNGPATLTIRGRNFPRTITGATLAGCVSGRPFFGCGSPVNCEVVSDRELRATFNFMQRPAGKCTIRFSAADGTEVLRLYWTEPAALEIVQAPPPVVTGITPSSAPNWGPVDVNITGTGFVQGASVVLSGFGDSRLDDCGPIWATGVQVVSDSLIRCRLDLTGAALGRHCFAVQNRDLQGCQLPDGFEVTQAAPVSITDIRPSSAPSVGPVDLRVMGTGFHGSMRLVMCTREGPTSVAATDMVVLNSSQLRCRMDFTGRPTGKWTVYVVRSDGEYALLCQADTNAFQVGDGP